MSDRRRRTKHDVTFIMHSEAMRNSPAWLALQRSSHNAWLVMERLEREHMAHGGAENGRLMCTFDDFEKAGIRRQSIGEAIRIAEALGFVEVPVRGGRSRSENRWPSQYRLTYVNGTKTSVQPTHDWERINTIAEADAEIKAARAAKQKRVHKRRKSLDGASKKTESRVQKCTSSLKVQKCTTREPRSRVQTCTSSPRCKNAPPVYIYG